MPLFVKIALVISTLVLVGVYVGVWFRRDRRRHVPIMITCGIVDIALVIAIIAFRRAVPTAMEAETTVLRIHLAFSIPSLACWITAFASGFQRLGGKWVRFHRWNAMVFLVCRTGNWATSFFVY